VSPLVLASGAPVCQSLANPSVGESGDVSGFMRQRGGSWELRIYAGRDAVTGRKRWVTRTVRGGKREAQRALAAMVAEIDRGGTVRTTATVGELLEEWFAHAAPGFSPKGAKETRGALDRNLLPFLGQVPLSKLGAADLDRFYRRLREKGGRAGRPLAPATIRRAHGILHRALGQGVRWGWLAVNPASSATPPRVPVPDIHPPAPHELARLFALAVRTDADLADFVMLAAATGARRSELLALRWSDLELDAGSVWVARAIVAGVVEKDTKTHAARRVSLDPTCAEAMRARRGRAVERARACEHELSLRAFVFSHEVDGSAPWYPDSASRGFARLGRQAGLQGVRLQDLRHYVATRLLSSGVDVRTVAGRLGHRNAATTLNVYSRFLAEADREAANVLGRIFDEAVAAATQGPAPEAFTTHVHVDEAGREHRYLLADRRVRIPWREGRRRYFACRQLTRLDPDSGHQTYVLTTRTDAAAVVAHAMFSRWRQENLFRYLRAHYGLDALDSYATVPDDLERSVPNPAKGPAAAAAAEARTSLARAEARLPERPPAHLATLHAEAVAYVEGLTTGARAIPARVPLGQLHPDAELHHGERKRIHDAVRMATYNAESALARLLAPHYRRAEDEARSVLREAMRSPADLEVVGGQLHVRLDPLSAPRRSRAIAALCEDLNANDTVYPGTEFVLRYSVKET
jgi:integrase